MQNKVGSENVPGLEREKTEYQVITMHVTESSEKCYVLDRLHVIRMRALGREI